MTVTADIRSARPGSVNRASKYRPNDDYYETPREALAPFLDAYEMPGAIWEPACGAGAISRTLIERGHIVVSTNLVDRGYGEAGVDFFDCHELRAPAILTNPPFGPVDAFISHALDLDPTVAAFLLRTKWVEGAKRYEQIIRERPPRFIYQFVERIKFFAGDAPKDEQPGWNTEAFAWFVWERGFKGDPSIRWIRRGA